MTIDFIVNHVWQSTWFAVAAAGVAFAFRRSPPRVRYWIWTSASLKFLMPFAAIVSLGGLVPWPEHHLPPVHTSALPDTIAYVATPFPGTSHAPVAIETSFEWTSLVLGVGWALGFAAVVWTHWRRWQGIRRAIRHATPIALPIQLPALITPGVTGPGIVGCLRPVLVLPAALLERFTPQQLEAVLAHEWSHVRRRDNLLAAVHMMVESIFWFHPLVWWIGARTIEERELACDEAVLGRGCEATDYVQSILTVCRFHSESRLPCVAGVTGGDLKKRVHVILAGRTASELNPAKKIALAMIGLATIAVPIGIGVLDSALVHAQSLIIVADGALRPSFGVASVKPVDKALMTRNHEGKRLTPTVFIDRTELMAFIVRAYVRGGGCDMKVALGEDCPVIVGTLPPWLKTDRFEIQGTLPRSTPTYSDRQVREGDTPQVNLMLQVLLEDRFRLKVHRETRELPVYALVVGKNGPKLDPPVRRVVTGPGGTQVEIHGIGMVLAVRGQDGTSRRRMNFESSSMQDAADGLAVYFDRPLIDRTALSGEFNFTIEHEVDLDAPAPPFVPNPSGRGGNYANPFTGLTAAELSRALQDVGLRLESTKAPLEVLVIDHVEKPSEN
ncbi:MAG TPA: M56 family metallopeptidase [Vicinamibacterales bacterium]|nr:M56 family metallopeptidase [Vicinamibacterales bacterium]